MHVYYHVLTLTELFSDFLSHIKIYRHVRLDSTKAINFPPFEYGQSRFRTRANAYAAVASSGAESKQLHKCEGQQNYGLSLNNKLVNICYLR